jgi:glycosyltransferase involved in cell wall biosynthesis
VIEKVSVVVPTRDRPAALAVCLGALSAQTTGMGLEVVVVDDGSVARAAVAAVASEFGARLVRLDGAGPSAARNAGVEEARGDRILMLDDDCVPQAGWVQLIVASVARGTRLVVAGAVLAPPAAAVWLRASERIAIESEAASGFVRTLNLACDRELLVQVPFDESFRVAAGEDRDWCVRAARAGATFVREPGAIVEHRADLGAQAFVRQQLRYGRAIHRLRRKGTHRPASRSAHGRALARGFSEGIPVGLAMMAASVAIATGYVLERQSDLSR